MTGVRLSWGDAALAEAAQRFYIKACAERCDCCPMRWCGSRLGAGRHAEHSAAPPSAGDRGRIPDRESGGQGDGRHRLLCASATARYLYLLRSRPTAPPQGWPAWQNTIRHAVGIAPRRRSELRRRTGGLTVAGRSIVGLQKAVQSLLQPCQAVRAQNAACSDRVVTALRTCPGLGGVVHAAECRSDNPQSCGPRESVTAVSRDSRWVQCSAAGLRRVAAVVAATAAGPR